MKYLNIIFVALSIILCSCNHNEEPDLEITLPVSESYLPVSVEFNEKELNDEQKRQLIHLVNNEHIINDVSEIPSDPLGLNDDFGYAFSKINFNEHTLILKYMLHDYKYISYRSRYYRNTRDNTYNWVINVGKITDNNTDSEDLYFTRFAILVRKLPADAKFTSWFSLTDHAWDAWQE